MCIKKINELFDRFVKSKISFLFGVCAIYILILTLKPFDFSSKYFVYDETFWEIILTGFLIKDMVINIILFLPFGFLCGLVLIKESKSKLSVQKWVTIYGLLLSFSVETAQLFLDRVSTISDIISNGLGAYLGTLIALRTDTGKIRHFLSAKKTLLKKIAFLYYAIALCVFLLPLLLNNFSNWANDYFLLIGNEATLNRPWEGTIYELAIYNRILEKDEIKAHYVSGSVAKDLLKREQSLIAHYNFSTKNDTIIKNHAAEKSLDLMAPTPSRIRSTDSNNGLQILWGGLLKTAVPASYLTEALKSTNQLTVELWMQPAILTQTGPARIVSLSADSRHRNFTLGQVKKAISFRVRTPLNGPNGSWCEFTSIYNVLSTQKQHIVVAYNRGTIQLFCNGVKIAGRCGSVHDYLPTILHFGSKRFCKLTFYFVILFPLGWMLNLIYRRKYIITLMLTISPLVLARLVLLVCKITTFSSF